MADTWQLSWPVYEVTTGQWTSDTIGGFTCQAGQSTASRSNYTNPLEPVAKPRKPRLPWQGYQNDLAEELKKASLSLAKVTGGPGEHILMHLLQYGSLKSSPYWSRTQRSQLETFLSTCNRNTLVNLPTTSWEPFKGESASGNPNMPYRKDAQNSLRRPLELRQLRQRQTTGR